jgi:gas vesicle protein
MNNQTKLIAGILAGTAAVAAIGLLFYTDKGNDIREEITDYLADLVNTVKTKAQLTADNVAQLKNDAVNTARSAVKKKVDEAADIAIN